MAEAVTPGDPRPPETRAPLAARIFVSAYVLLWVAAMSFCLLSAAALLVAPNHPWILRARARGWGQRTFDSAVWKAHEPHKASTIEEEDVRGEMLYDLLGKHELRGMSKPEIEALLGPPTTWQGDVALYGIGKHTWIDPDFLYVFFGDDGRVVKYAVFQN